jgi:hypothetical protein
LTHILRTRERENDLEMEDLKNGAKRKKNVLSVWPQVG